MFTLVIKVNYPKAVNVPLYDSVIHFPWRNFKFLEIFSKEFLFTLIYLHCKMLQIYISMATILNHQLIHKHYIFLRKHSSKTFQNSRLSYSNYLLSNRWIFGEFFFTILSAFVVYLF